ncbi:protein-S-isoprenylcysteine O-methyltransferase Ste14 [Microbacterium sp. ZKA21]|uniref:methyltransferase family protein n=1 Tax=Microbacterium sp. ZKA21 TaxID=3381694 RepID=UPI003D1F722B
MIHPTARTGRTYFALQAVAGAVWWIMVGASPTIRTATLGTLDPVLVAMLDLPLFVIASALAACGLRWAVWIVMSWTILVAAGMAGYATIAGSAGWGALLMIAAAGGSGVAGLLVLRGRLPSEWLLTGPFRFRTAPERGSHLGRTFAQIIVFWGLFLVVLPAVIAAVEHRWVLTLEVGPPVRIVGAVLLIAMSALGLWSAVTMSKRGDGTPLPSAMPHRLVISGPYRFVRNPMALAGIAQGVAVGMLLGSWLVVLCALCGSLVWNFLIRPHEEADLARRFGAAFEDYRRRVRCWIPSLPVSGAPTAGRR